MELTGDRADRKFGINRPMMALGPNQKKSVVKTNVSPEVSHTLALERNRNGVLASQILCSLGLPCVPAYEARWREGDEWVEGSVTSWLTGSKTLVEVSSGKLYALDLDKAFSGNFPVKSSAFYAIMTLYATPARVEPELYRIRRFSDAQLEELLDELGPKYLKDWTPELRQRYLQSLQRQREQLVGGSNPYLDHYGRSGPWFRRTLEPVRESEGDSRVR